MHEEPVNLASGNGRLCGMLHQPDGSSAGCLVFCNPLFEERKSAQRILVEAARALCAEGFAVLRFDYRGCGDSEGDFPAFSVGDWLDDIQVASTCLRQRFPGCPAGLLGLRLGASLACDFAARARGYDFAILWEPVLKGREYLEQELRRKLMKEMMTFGKSQVSRDALIQSLEAGQAIDFDGYSVTPALHRDMGGLDLPALKTGMPGRCLILSIGSSGRPSPTLARLAEAFRAAGSAVDLKGVREQPFWNLVGLVPCPDLIRETVSWLKASSSSGAGA